jgi:hypothetical protein
MEGGIHNFLTKPDDYWPLMARKLIPYDLRKRNFFTFSEIINYLAWYNTTTK